MRTLCILVLQAFSQRTTAVDGMALRSILQMNYYSARKAVPTIAVDRRVDVSAIEIEVVRIELRLVGADSPVDAILARGPQGATLKIRIPATS